MGNAESHEVAFLVEPMDPLPIVLREFCVDSLTSIQIPPFMSRTKHDGVVQKVDGDVAFLWKGSSMTLTNPNRTVSMHMERKVCENINTHTIVVDRGIHGASGWLADINVNFPFPSVYEPDVECFVQLDDTRVHFTVQGDWGSRNAVISMHIGQQSVAAARIRGVKQDRRPFDDYILDVIPGADVAFMVLLCTSIDRIAHLTRGVIV